MQETSRGGQARRSRDEVSCLHAHQHRTTHALFQKRDSRLAVRCRFVSAAVAMRQSPPSPWQLAARDPAINFFVVAYPSLNASIFTSCAETRDAKMAASMCLSDANLSNLLLLVVGCALIARMERSSACLWEREERSTQLLSDSSPACALLAGNLGKRSTQENKKPMWPGRTASLTHDSSSATPK